MAKTLSPETSAKGRMSSESVYCFRLVLMRAEEDFAVSLTRIIATETAEPTRYVFDLKMGCEQRRDMKQHKGIYSERKE